MAPRRDLARVAGQLGLLVYGLDGAVEIASHALRGVSWPWQALALTNGRLQALHYLAIVLALATVAVSLSARCRLTVALCAALAGVLAGHLELNAAYVLIPLRATVPQIVAVLLSVGWVVLTAAGLAFSHLGPDRPPHGGRAELARWVSVMVGPVLVVVAVWWRARMDAGAWVPDLTTLIMLGAGALYGWMQRKRPSEWRGPHWSAPTLLLMRATLPAQMAYAWVSDWRVPDLIGAALAVAATGAIGSYAQRRRLAGAVGVDERGVQNDAATP